MNPIYNRNSPYGKLENHWHGQQVVFNHVEYIKNLALWLKPERYLEVGIYENQCLSAIAPFCKEVYAVDIKLRNSNLPKNCSFFEMTSDIFFEKLDSSVDFDLVFIDGCHSHEQSLKDFLNVKGKIIEDGFIIMHDSYPIDMSWAASDLCGEVYKTVEYIKKHFIYEFEILTLPFHPGLSIIKKMNINKQLCYKP